MTSKNVPLILIFNGYVAELNPFVILAHGDPIRPVPFVSLPVTEFIQH